MKKIIIWTILLVFPATTTIGQTLPRSIMRYNSDLSITNVEIERLGGTPYDGGRVWVSFTMISPKTLSANALITLSPTMQGAGAQSLDMPKIALLKSATQRSYERGGGEFEPTTLIVRPGEVVEYSVGIPFEKWMNGASLVINSCAKTRAKAYELPTEVIAYDLELAQQRIEPLLVFAVPLEVKKERREQGSAFLEFRVGSDEILPHYATNPQELHKIRSSISNAMEQSRGNKIEKIVLWGTSSPEGNYHYNAKLARSRTEALRDYISMRFGYDIAIFSVSSTPENWVGLRTMVESSTLFNRDQIIEIIDNPELSPSQRDMRMRGLSNYNEILHHYYPLLRRVDYTIHYELQQYKTIEELVVVYNTTPENLSESELFELWQSYDPESQHYSAIIEFWANNLYPQSPAALINMATIALEDGDTLRARQWLRRAAAQLEIQGVAIVDDHTATYYNTAGALQLIEGDKMGAKLLFEKAAKLGLHAAQKNHEAMLD